MNWFEWLSENAPNKKWSVMVEHSVFQEIEKNRKGENYEIPLAQAKESGEKIDESLLELAASVITEITTNPEW